MPAESTSRARPVLGVTLGLLIDLLGSLAVAGALSIAYMFLLARNGTQHRALIAAFTDGSPDSVFFLLCMSVLAFCCFFGALVCQRLARWPDLRLTWFKAVVCVAAVLALSWPLYSWVQLLLMSALTVASLVIGAKLAGRMRA